MGRRPLARPGPCGEANQKGRARRPAGPKRGSASAPQLPCMPAPPSTMVLQSARAPKTADLRGSLSRERLADLGDVADHLHIRAKEIEIAGELLLAQHVDDHIGMPHRLRKRNSLIVRRSTRDTEERARTSRMLFESRGLKATGMICPRSPMTLQHAPVNSKSRAGNAAQTGAKNNGGSKADPQNKYYLRCLAFSESPRYGTITCVPTRPSLFTT